MPPDSYALEQRCPACGSAVDVTAEEPLARVTCPACGAKFRVERAFDNFVLVETVGVGGMGSVYKARDGRLDRFVALKLLRKELSADPREAVRLEQEARLTASISHPHVGQVFSSGSDHGQFYLVMELMEHGSLDDLIAQHGRVPEASVLEAGIQVAQGLQAALEKGLIHRDVKPANILFADAHTAKIVDFGLAVAAEQNSDAPGEIWGTPYYVAPERINNEPEDFRSDIYSLGATMFHALAGRPPIEGETNSAAVLRELKNRPMNLTAAAPGVSRPTARLIQRMLNPNAARRFSSYRELIAQMQRVHRTLVGRRAPTSEQRGRTRALVTALAVLAVVVVCLGAYVYQSRVRQPATGLTAKGASPPVSAATVNLQRRYEEARRQLLAGKFSAAATAFGRVASDAGDEQPLASWASLHRGLAALLAGHAPSARKAFQDAARAPLPSKSRPDLARFFAVTSRALTGPEPVGADTFNATPAQGLPTLALFLFGTKDWQGADFDLAAKFFEKFMKGDPGHEWEWVNDYKPLARTFLEDYRLYSVWKTQAQDRASADATRALLTNVRSIEERLQNRGALANELKEEENALVRQLDDREKAESQTRAMATTKALEKETPVVTAALTAYRKRVAAYDFEGAARVVVAPRISEAGLKQTLAEVQKKAAWLVGWKNQLIADLGRAGFAGPVADIFGTQYKGIAGADQSHLTLELPYGSAKVDWRKFAPKTLLAVSNVFIQPGAPDAADRQWLCAIFAQETNQSAAARMFGEAAASSKPGYREQLRVLTTKAKPAG
ncbi:MAG TPA: protein kinase [Chthoniobacterales bacterium]|nr:protein kinase [Chthoniobacterales bacterium]